MARRRPRDQPAARPARVPVSADDADLLDLARKRFKQWQDADQKQLQRELDDLRFAAGDQWDPDVKKARDGQQASGGMPPVPARPCFTVDKVRASVNQVLNDERASDMGVEIAAADDFEGLSAPIDDTEIQLREGLVRRIQRSSEAADARSWAFDRATKSGRGYYGVMTRFLPGKTYDQDLGLRRFYNQSSVGLDPAHEQPDGSDAEWGFVGSDMPWAQYKAEFPKAANGKPNPVIGAGDDDFRGLGDDYPGWFTSEGETRSCRVVEYWYTERQSRTLVQLEDGSVAWKDEQPDATTTDEREVIEKTIKWCKIDGVQVLDRTDWPGPDIPIVKVLGVELQPYDRERRAEGMIRPARDAQRGFNAMVSKWVETIAFAAIPPWVMAEGQAAGYEAWWEASNTRSLPFLYYRPKALDGTTPGEPHRTNVDTPIQAIAGSIQMFDEAIQSTTNVPDSRIGRNTDSHLKSGKAIEALQSQSQHGTSNFLDNLKRSIRYEGQILNNLLYSIYGRPGRLVRIMTGQGETERVQIAPPASSPDPAQAGATSQNGQKAYRLTKDANFNVIIKVTRSFESRRDQEASTIGELIAAQPQLMAVFGDLFFKHQDGPGHEEMADRAKVMLDPKIQAMLDAKKAGADVPPALMAKLAQQQQQIQHAEQVMQQMNAELTSKKAETDSRERIAAAQLASTEKLQIELKRMDVAAKIEVARIAAAKQAADTLLEAQEEALALNQQQAHDVGMAALDHAHTLQQADQQHQQTLEQGQQSAETQAQLADQGHANALEQQAAQTSPQADGAGV